MVSKITLLEPHFDGAQFGPKTIDGEAFSDAEESDREKSRDDAEESGAKSRMTMVIQGLIGSIFLAVVIYASLRLATSGDE
jgi:hypothetical protein